MPEENSGSVEGILDVGVIVPICFENPLKEDSVAFLEDVPLGKRRAIIPTSAVLGSYHEVTNYLGVSRQPARKILTKLLETSAGALYPHITPDLASEALDYASVLGIESWDGYLIALARKFNAKVLFSLDEELKRKVSYLTVASPFNNAKVRQYHDFVLRASKKARL